ncbi:MAG: glycosyl hydrolase 2 galactose-binding domain-containing protein, partial [Plesiomonas sp.]
MPKLNLHGDWTLTSPQHPHIHTCCPLPGDIHSALLDAGLIPDPYFANNEPRVQWVGESEWHLSRSFTLSSHDMTASRLLLSLTFVDTMASVWVNGQPVLQCHNMFRRFEADILPWVVAGENQIQIQLQRNDIEAAQRASRLSFPIPWAQGNNQIPHMNLLRKTQCHAGWDWGICLLVSGVYGEISLEPVFAVQPLQIRTEQEWRADGSCRLHVDCTYQVDDASAPLMALISVLPPGQESVDSAAHQSEQIQIELPPQPCGEGHFRHSIEISHPQRWWPAGYGPQPLYRLQVAFMDVSAPVVEEPITPYKKLIEKRIGLRQLELVTEEDAIGSSMLFRVNGQAITAKGANWIPLDARPSRHTPERYRRLLEDAVAANMNMLRVWGGGMYEQDIFYDLCDELGVLVWQDLMFSCALYPSTPEFLLDVEHEVRYQVQRLADHPSLALWCGDNEVIGAIGWYPESREHRIKYTVNYDRLNRLLASVVEREDPSRRFWASSPCNGELDFGDAWHDDHRGDMHFWDVWHSGKSFDAYHSVKPRFCSEFGFQSWPSLPTVKQFAEEDDWNITSPTFEQHQKNGRGNSIITEMITRYFRFPIAFEQQLYLSQVQQALAIKTATEYWRAYKDHCRGVLYWQLNDCWPVSSWSSIEYSGRWKLLHYHARHFFAPLLATFIHEADTSGQPMLTLHLVNDRHAEQALQGEVLHISWQGDVLQRWPLTCIAQPDSAAPIWQIPLSTSTITSLTEARRGFYHVVLHADPNPAANNSEHREAGLTADVAVENSFYPDAFKRLPLQPAQIAHRVGEDAQGRYIELWSQHPALFVHVEFAGEGRFEDSGFTLLPEAVGGRRRVR